MDNSPVSHKSNLSKSRIVEAKVADGDVRGAVRVLSSPFGVVKATKNTYEELLHKHPPPSRASSFPDPPTEVDTPPLIATPDQVLHAINSFPNRSSAGIDGLRPQHLKDLTSKSAGDSGRRLLHVVTKLCNLMLAGKVNNEICPFLYGASLIAIGKKDGGVRPVAVGNTFRRIAAKIGCMAVKEEVSVHLRPHQLGFGTPRGCEAIIYSARTFLLNSENTSNVFLKIDFHIAFNCLERDSMLAAVRDKAPQLFAFLWQAYRNPSHFFFIIN